MDTRISEKELRAFMERAYEKEGFKQEEARRIADVLMQADLFGIESHGAQRMTSKAEASMCARGRRLCAKRPFPRCWTAISRWDI